MTVWGTPVSLALVVLLVVMMVVCLAGYLVGCTRVRRGGKFGCCSFSDGSGATRTEEEKNSNPK